MLSSSIVVSLIALVTTSIWEARLPPEFLRLVNCFSATPMDEVKNSTASLLRFHMAYIAAPVSSSAPIGPPISVSALLAAVVAMPSAVCAAAAVVLRPAILASAN